MPKLYVVIDVPDERADPKTTDPHDIGEDLVYTTNESDHANGVYPGFTFVAAEWSLAALGEATDD